MPTHFGPMSRRGFTGGIAALIAMGGPAGAQSIMRPQPGDPLRAEILDAVRPVFEGETWGPIEFVVRALNVLDNWGFGDVKLQRPGGRPIDWSKTRYGEAMRQGMFDPSGSFFLLYRMGSSWAIVKFVTGPTDVAWDGWRTEYDIPAELFARPLR